MTPPPSRWGGSRVIPPSHLVIIQVVGETPNEKLVSGVGHHRRDDTWGVGDTAVSWGGTGGPPRTKPALGGAAVWLENGHPKTTPPYLQIHFGNKIVQTKKGAGTLQQPPPSKSPLCVGGGQLTPKGRGAPGGPPAILFRSQRKKDPRQQSPGLGRGFPALCGPPPPTSCPIEAGGGRPGGFGGPSAHPARRRRDSPTCRAAAGSRGGDGSSATALGR